MTSGRIIVFSGLDGSGKSTQIEHLKTTFAANGLPVQYIWTRGGYTGIFEALKRFVRRFGATRGLPGSGPSEQRTQAFRNPLIRKSWLILAILDLMWVYGVRVRFWRACGQIVICDRYLWDTLIDFRLNFLQESTENWVLWQILENITPQPDAAFLLLIPVAESVRRSDIKGEPYRESPDVLSERLAHYKQLAKAGYWQVLDGQHTVEYLADEIRHRVEIIMPGDSHRRIDDNL